jgi:hypothetical protein
MDGWMEGGREGASEGDGGRGRLGGRELRERFMCVCVRERESVCVFALCVYCVSLSEKVSESHRTKPQTLNPK